MKVKILLVPALLLMALATATPALAQNRAGSWEFGPYLVGFDFDHDTEIEDAWGGGFRFGYNFLPQHELEFSFEGVDTEDNVFHVVDVKVGQFQANYVFNFLFDRHQVVVPYVTAGLGNLRLEVHSPGFPSDEENDPLFSGGGGVRFFVGKEFNVRLDLRFVSFTGDNVVLRDIGFTDNQFSVGVGWVLGGR